MDRPIIQEMDQILDEEFPGAFSYDREKAAEKGVVELCWALTKKRLPLNVEISERVFEKRLLPRRELLGKLRACLPETLARQQISAVNTLLRNAHRQGDKTAFKKYREWMKETEKLLISAVGAARMQGFLDPHDRSESLRTLIEEKVEWLKNFEVS